jgi:hypothetical protein
LGVEKEPAGSDFASEIVVSGSVSVARLSHVAALADRGRKPDAADKTITHRARALHGMPDGLAGRWTLIAGLRTPDWSVPGVVPQSS